MHLVLLAGLMRSCNRYDSKSDFDAETLGVNIRLSIMWHQL
jgi:hypothetical protein